MGPIAIDFFFDEYVRKFRVFNHSSFRITIHGMLSCNDLDASIIHSLCERFKDFGFEIVVNEVRESMSFLDINCDDVTNNTSFSFLYQIQNIPHLAELSSRCCIPIVGIVLMRVVARVISHYKVIYKALVLDLDNTLWEGTLSEDGVSKIRDNMLSSKGKVYLSFMSYIRELSKELGLFVAICSKNNQDEVLGAIEDLGEDLFPIKNQIDCIVANYNSKSDNVLLISQQLSILPDSMVFIDDNEIIRDEIRTHIPKVCVPEWTNHFDLVSLLIAGCLFERKEISAKAQERKTQYRLIQTERANNALPALPVRVFEDDNHSHAIDLYLKSNQFNFSQINESFDLKTRSLYYNIYRRNGDDLGVCAAVSYIKTEKDFLVLNWAISCRFFGIGLEEAILLHLHNIAGSRRMSVLYNDNELNRMVSDFLSRYPQVFVKEESSREINIIITQEIETSLNCRTALIIG